MYSTNELVRQKIKLVKQINSGANPVGIARFCPVISELNFNVKSGKTKAVEEKVAEEGQEEEEEPEKAINLAECQFENRGTVFVS